MKVKYFQDTDTLYIEFKTGSVVETKDLDENTQLDVDGQGKICALTIEHARDRADLQHFSFEQRSEANGNSSRSGASTESGRPSISQD